jgi:hypothetical protein
MDSNISDWSLPMVALFVIFLVTIGMGALVSNLRKNRQRLLVRLLDDRLFAVFIGGQDVVCEDDLRARGDRIVNALAGEGIHFTSANPVVVVNDSGHDYAFRLHKIAQRDTPEGDIALTVLTTRDGGLEFELVPQAGDWLARTVMPPGTFGNLLEQYRTVFMKSLLPQLDARELHPPNRLGLPKPG